jgi:hypothetical protein
MFLFARLINTKELIEPDPVSDSEKKRVLFFENNWVLSLVL